MISLTLSSPCSNASKVCDVSPDSLVSSLLPGFSGALLYRGAALHPSKSLREQGVVGHNATVVAVPVARAGMSVENVIKPVVRGLGHVTAGVGTGIVEVAAASTAVVMQEQFDELLAQFDELLAEVKQLRKENAELRKENAELRKENADLKKRLAQVERDFEEYRNTHP
jgi:hypothetical protein